MTWFDRVRPPRGFAPAYHLAEALASSSLTSAATACERLAVAEYGHFPTFALALTQVLAALHSLIHFGERKDAETSVADLGARLAEGLSLLETAQRELAAKVTQLSASDAAVAKAQTAAQTTEDLSREAKAVLEALEGLSKTANTQSADVASTLEEAEKLRIAMDATSMQSAKLASDLEKLQADLVLITKKAQEQQALITALLPKGASAGLASAFALRVDQLERTKWLWTGTFGIAIAGLSMVAGWVLYLSGSSEWVSPGSS